MVCLFQSYVIALVYFSDKIARDLTIKHMFWIKTAFWFIYFSYFRSSKKCYRRTLKLFCFYFYKSISYSENESHFSCQRSSVLQTKIVDSSTPCLSMIYTDNSAPAITIKRGSWETLRKWHYLGFISVIIEVVMSKSQIIHLDN